ncbi:MAG: DUF4249 family protein [Chitinophagales bacterium]
MKKIIIYTFSLLMIAYVVTSCEKDVIIDLPASTQKIVVEGNVTIGEPIILTLTTTIPYYDTIDLQTFENNFAHDAEVKIWNSNGDTMNMVEFCIADIVDFLDPEDVETFGDLFGFNLDSIDVDEIPNFCFYIDEGLADFSNPQPTFLGEENTTYHLEINTTDGQLLTAETTIPVLRPPNFLELAPHPSEAGWYRVDANLTIPNTPGQYVRFKTAYDTSDFVAPNPSVYDDNTFTSDNSTITLPLQRGYSDGEDVELSLFNYFEEGAWMYLEWSNIDYATFDFWTTIENDGGDSPFSSPVEITGNINGGLGHFGGYATTIDSIYVGP